jgi:hypothetical protein
VARLPWQSMVMVVPAWGCADVEDGCAVRRCRWVEPGEVDGGVVLAG